MPSVKLPPIPIIFTVSLWKA